MTTGRHEEPSRQQAIPLARRGFPAWIRSPLPLLWLMVGAYTAFFLALTLTSHAAFGTSALDLGIYDQVVWNTAHGRPFAYSAEPWYGDVFLATHLQPVLALLAPIYWIWSDARALIVLQTLAIAASGLLVYVLAGWRLGRPWAALAITFAYLMFPALQSVNHFVFHPESFEPFLLLGAFALLEIAQGHGKVSWLSRRRALVLFWAALVLALAVKEDVAFVVVALGAYLWIARRARRLGLAVMAVTVAWFAVGMFLVLPHFRGGEPSPFLSYYAYLGSGPAEIVRTLVTQPMLALQALLTAENAGMVLALLIPLGLLPLLEPGILLIAAPSLLVYGLSAHEPMHRMEQFQYAAPLIPWVTLAAIYGLGRWFDGLRRPAWLASRKLHSLPLVVLLGCSLAYQGLRGFTPLSRLYRWPEVTGHHRLGRALVDEIPPAAPLVAQDCLYPHLSQRQEISFLWPSEPWAEYIFLDVSHPTLNNADNLTTWLRDQVQQQAGYGLVVSRDGYLLLERGAAPQPLSEEFCRFATVESPAIEHPLAMETAEGIRFLGYDVVKERYANTLLVLYFTAARPLAQDYFAGLYLLSEGGEVLGKTVYQQPTLVWYPTNRWRPGETVRVVANTLAWAAEPDRFGLGLVVLPMEAASPGGMAGQPEGLKWLPAGAGTPARLLEGETVLWLGDFRSGP